MKNRDNISKRERKIKQKGGAYEEMKQMEL